jgi:hypothetical protein
MSANRRMSAKLCMTFGLVLLGLIALAINGGASAADFESGYAPYPNAAPNYDRPIERERFYSPAPSVDRRYDVVDERCRTYHERRVDPYGREIVHRIRVCDEGPVNAMPNRAYGPAPYESQPRAYYERSRYRAYPRPPVEVDDY